MHLKFYMLYEMETKVYMISIFILLKFSTHFKLLLLKFLIVGICLWTCTQIWQLSKPTFTQPTKAKF